MDLEAFDGGTFPIIGNYPSSGSPGTAIPDAAFDELCY